MDAKRLVFGLFSALIGLISGILAGLRHNRKEITVLRQIIRDNQQHNFEAMQAKRSQRNDEAR